ncbi:MAG TPA: hypothetical protein ENO20_04595 [Bacteroides sp.]|nr:hypothetical protein [Bacteroides sp.]
MPRDPNKLNRIWQELKRRNVVRVITVYAAAAFVILELVSIIVEPLRLPEWTLPLIIVLLCIGFIIAVILSWIYDVTPEGIERTDQVKEPREEIPGQPSRLVGWKIATYLSLLVIAGMVTFHLISRSKQNESKLETSIAVLPFENWSSDAAYFYLGDAITDEIILQLWQANVFDRVLSRSSTMQYRESRTSIPAIAGQLGVNYIIEGSIQRQADHVSIRVQVIRARNEDHIWAHEYNGEWKDIHSIQDNIAKEIAEKLKVVLTPVQLVQIEQIPTSDFDAYEYYLLGKYLRSQRTPESLLKAKGHFEKAIEIDPGFARAYTELARCYGNLAFYGSLRPGEAYPPALELAKKALEIDSLFGEAYTVIAVNDLFFSYDFAGAEKNLQRALELDPNNLEVYKSLSELYFFSGQFNESVKMDQRALILHPAYPLQDALFGIHLYFAHYKDSAISVIKEKIRRDTGCTICHTYLGVIYLHEGEYNKSITEFEKSLSSFSPFAFTQLGLAYSKSGNLNATRSILDTLESRAKDEYIPYSMRGALLAELGRDQEALDYLRRGYEEREEYLLLMLHIDTISYGDLRADPRFIEIYKKVWSEG